MNPRTRHARLFARLALLAALLLACVPTLGRLLSAGAAPSVAVAHATAMQMATDHAMGRAMSGAAAQDGSHGSAPGMPPHSGHAHDADCAYCPLLGAALAAQQVVAPEIPASTLPGYFDRQIASAPLPARPRGARGSRGPPAAA